MGAKGGGKVEVSEYSMSMHLGVCHAVDAFTSITIGEKLAWSGLHSTARPATSVASMNRRCALKSTMC